MENCIFCKIVAGEIPCYKTYEDDLFLGFLDIRPLNKGNSLLIPKTHHRWVNDVPEFGKYWEAARILALKTTGIVNSDFITYLTLGEEVLHAHIRIIPRFENDPHNNGIDLSVVVDISADEMKALAEKILL